MTPVGTLLISTFDHGIFAVMCRSFECLKTVGNFVVMVLEIWSYVEASCWSVLECPPVRTIFPFMVHLAEEMWVCGRDESLRSSFIALQRMCEGGRLAGSALAV